MHLSIYICVLDASHGPCAGRQLPTRRPARRTQAKRPISEGCGDNQPQQHAEAKPTRPSRHAPVGEPQPCASMVCGAKAGRTSTPLTGKHSMGALREGHKPVAAHTAQDRTHMCRAKLCFSMFGHKDNTHCSSTLQSGLVARVAPSRPTTYPMLAVHWQRCRATISTTNNPL